MTAKLTFFPTGNADTTLIRLADDRLVLLDYADMHNPDDPYDQRCDLAVELRKELSDADQKDFAVVCFTVSGAPRPFGFRSTLTASSTRASVRRSGLGASR